MHDDLIGESAPARRSAHEAASAAGARSPTAGSTVASTPVKRTPRNGSAEAGAASADDAIATSAGRRITPCAKRYQPPSRSGRAARSAARRKRAGESASIRRPSSAKQRRHDEQRNGAGERRHDQAAERHRAQEAERERRAASAKAAATVTALNATVRPAVAIVARTASPHGVAARRAPRGTARRAAGCSRSRDRAPAPVTRLRAKTETGVARFTARSSASVRAIVSTPAATRQRAPRRGHGRPRARAGGAAETRSARPGRGRAPTARRHLLVRDGGAAHRRRAAYARAGCAVAADVARVGDERRRDEHVAAVGRDGRARADVAIDGSRRSLAAATAASAGEATTRIDGPGTTPEAPRQRAAACGSSPSCVSWKSVSLELRCAGVDAPNAPATTRRPRAPREDRRAAGGETRSASSPEHGREHNA